MAKEYDKEALQSRNNVLQARCRNLEEQAVDSNRQWKEVEMKFKKTEDRIRELCETILAKDRSEMKLGENKSWYDTSTDELIKKTVKSYKKYCLETTSLLKTIQSESESRRAKIESLEQQINRYLGKKSDGVSDDENDEDQNDAEQKDEISAADVRGIKLPDNVKVIFEEPGDMDTQEDMKHINELMDVNEQSKMIPNAIPISEPAEKINEILKEKEKKVMSHMVDLNEIEKRIDELMWTVVFIIGSEGISRYTEISKRVLEGDKKKNESQVRKAIQDLFTMGIISRQIFSLPTTPRCKVHKLTDIGDRLYKKKHNKWPVMPELEKVKSAHANAEHGYGIMDVGNILRESKRYKEVNIFNRKSAIEIKDKRKRYIPDIVCVAKDGKYNEYIEYERGTNTQRDFNAKCNKMVYATRYLNFVAQNKGVLNKTIKPQVEEWIKHTGIENLKNIKIRIATASDLKNTDKDYVWRVTYDLSKSEIPEINE